MTTSSTTATLYTSTDKQPTVTLTHTHPTNSPALRARRLLPQPRSLFSVQSYSQSVCVATFNSLVVRSARLSALAHCVRRKLVRSRRFHGSERFSSRVIVAPSSPTPRSDRPPGVGAGVAGVCLVFDDYILTLSAIVCVCVSPRGHKTLRGLCVIVCILDRSSEPVRVSG